MKIKKILFTILVVIATLLIFNLKSEATLELNELNFDVQINSDGSMDVTETWDIDISNTNTLYKTFKIDNSKYSSITQAQVTDISSNIKFSQINEEMYHVTKDCYYALKNSDGVFEIAWGVGLENSSAQKTYQISYKVNDAIAKYNDYAELYWQFIGEDFEIDADKITGTIYLPFNVTNKEDIRVWGHTRDLNGEIYVTDLNKIEFTVNNYSSGNYIEIRTLIPNDLISYSARTYDTNILEKVLSEEEKWANEANKRRKAKENLLKIIKIISIVLSVIFGIIIFVKIVKLIKLEKKIKPTTKLQYYRDLPYEDATPGEALFMITSGTRKGFLDGFAANILDLCLKKYITLEVVERKNKIKKDEIKINILNKQSNYLKEDEKLTLELLKKAQKEDRELTTKVITKYFEKNPTEIILLNKQVEEILEKREQETGKFVKKAQNEYNNQLAIVSVYIGISIISAFVSIPLAIILGLNCILSGLLAYKINVFTQKGVDEKEQWKAFKKYMEEFSLLKDKEVPALAIWEKYLVFATAFGISDKVLKQLKVVYPEILDMNSSLYTTYSYIHIMNTVNIGNCINSSVYTATYSSGSGAGGGFSGGGGGGRWPEAAVADANKRGQFSFVQFYIGKCTKANRPFYNRAVHFCVKTILFLKIGCINEIL